MSEGWHASSALDICLLFHHPQAINRIFLCLIFYPPDNHRIKNG